MPKKDAFQELEILAKSFATTMLPTTDYTVRTHKRKFENRKMGTKVKPYRRRKFAVPGQMNSVDNVQDV